MSQSSPRCAILAAIAAGLSLSRANADIVPIMRFSEVRFVTPGQPPIVASTTAFGFWEYGSAQVSNTLPTGATLMSLVIPGGNTSVGSSTFWFTFSVLETHRYTFSGSAGGVPGIASGSAALSGPGVNHLFSGPPPVSFNVTGYMQPGTYTVRGDSSAGGVGVGASRFDLLIEVPAPATALLAPVLVLAGRRRRPIFV